jgi:hypothetical protein
MPWRDGEETLKAVRAQSLPIMYTDIVACSTNGPSALNHWSLSKLVSRDPIFITSAPTTSPTANLAH